MEVDLEKAVKKGLVATVKDKKHFFCSTSCLSEFEKKHNIKSKLTRKPWFKVTLYIVIVLLLIGLVAVLQITGSMVIFMGIFFVIVSLLKFADWKGFAQAFSMYDIIAKK